MERTPATDAFWSEYATGTAGDDGYTVAAFGDSSELITELTALVVEGRKRATASLVRDFEVEDRPLPRVGDHWVVVDATGEPVCICRTTHVRVGPVDSVDDDFAWDEGEGDRTRDTWLQDHLRFFRRQAEREGWIWSDAEPCVFERFIVVWPPSLADSAGPRPFDLGRRYLHLGSGSRAAEVPVGDDFWAVIDERDDLGEGRLVMVSTSDATWPHWERHPAGEELVMLLSGRADLVIELDDRTGDDPHMVPLEPGEAVLVPPGAWHRAVVHEPARILTITAGKGTEHRPHT